MPEEASTRQAHDSGDDSIDAGVARDLSEIARDLEAQPDSQAVMQRIVQAAVDEVRGCVGAAVTLLTKGVVSSPAQAAKLHAVSDWHSRKRGKGRVSTPPATK